MRVVGARRVGADAEGRLLLQLLQVATLTGEPGVLGLPGLPSLLTRRLRVGPGRGGD